MTFLKTVLMGMMGVSFGFLSSAGVFTVLATVGLVPRFAGKMHISKHVFLLEEMVVLGSVAGCVLSVFEDSTRVGTWIRESSGWSPGLQFAWSILALVLITAFGLFSGMFVGCLAMAIAEALDSIPIFTRRISFRHGIGIVILAVAAGKLVGSFLYFSQALFHGTG